jgi:hypothetical protein
MNGREYYTRYLEVKKLWGFTGPVLLKEVEHPLQWSNWYRWFHHNGFIGACDRMASRNEYTVPCLDVGMFDPAFDPEAHPVAPRRLRDDDDQTGWSIKGAFDAMTPEARARCAETYRKFEAGIPINDEVARVWARMQPFWNSGNPAYVGRTKTDEIPVRHRTDEERLADLEARANDPIEISPALAKALKAKEDK